MPDRFCAYCGIEEIEFVSVHELPSIGKVEVWRCQSDWLPRCKRLFWKVSVEHGSHLEGWGGSTAQAVLDNAIRRIPKLLEKAELAAARKRRRIRRRKR